MTSPELPAALAARLESEQKKFGNKDQTAEELAAELHAAEQRHQAILAERSEAAREEVERAKEIAKTHQHHSQV